MAEQRDDHVIDLDRFARPSGPRVSGAQWDELRGVWERWDETTQTWVIVGEGTPVPQPEIEPDIAMVPQRDDPDDDDEGHIGGHHIVDLDRAPRPEESGVPGAQWNEVVGRWEVWSESAGRWVDAKRTRAR